MCRAVYDLDANSPPEEAAAAAAERR